MNQAGDATFFGRKDDLAAIDPASLDKIGGGSAGHRRQIGDARINPGFAPVGVPPSVLPTPIVRPVRPAPPCICPPTPPAAIAL